MIPAIRAAFNEQFTEAKYLAYLAILNEPFKNPIPFRIAETPVFIDRFFKAQLMDAGDYICEFITKPSSHSRRPIPYLKDCISQMKQVYLNVL